LFARLRARNLLPQKIHDLALGGGVGGAAIAVADGIAGAARLA